MELSADAAAAIRFRGTRYAYDRREVDRFLEQVIATLAAHEAALAAADTKIRELERTQSHTPLRLRGRGGDEVAPSSDEVPPESFRRWLADRVAAAAHTRLRSAALEEARMIRAVAAEQASDEIDRLTASARAEALEVTRRAARLAGRTEEEARARAEAILDATVPGADVDVEVLAKRISDLRAGIAAVQARLEAAVPSGSDVITLDLRDAAVNEADDSAVAAGGTRTVEARRSRAKQRRTPTTAELEATMVELGDRLDRG